ncbi:methyltransferase domain-containing protein [Candidatus Pacearchaeota archaeon]|nr:methyltransferase domain-containing protein [Candidatus Pacearchaeota archaeon]
MNRGQLLGSLRFKGFSKEILCAFAKVRRENFVPAKQRDYAYDDMALSIGEYQTISQPYTIALMLSLLKLKQGQKVLEIGSGSGYVLALISEITHSKIFGIERIKKLAEKSKRNLKNYPNIKVHCGDGSKGFPENYATFVGGKEKSRPSALRGESARETRGSLAFDRILISAACEKLPKELVSQLKDKGIIVAPLGTKHGQSLIAFKKIKNKLKIKKQIPGFAFVPFI